MWGSGVLPIQIANPGPTNDFVCLLFGGHIWWYSRVTPGSVLRNHWKTLGTIWDAGD